MENNDFRKQISKSFYNNSNNNQNIYNKIEPENNYYFRTFAGKDIKSNNKKKCIQLRFNTKEQKKPTSFTYKSLKFKEKSNLSPEIYKKPIQSLSPNYQNMRKASKSFFNC